MKIKISDYIADFLVKHGIEHIFMVTGGGAMHLDDALGHKKELDCIYNHHEQACSIAAEGYRRLTGKLPAVCVTSGPGGTNALTGVLCAWLDSIPMFVLSGQVKTETTIHRCPKIPLRQLGDQEFNIVAAVSSMTKYAKFIDDAKEIAYHLEKALFLCENGRGGPVWLDIPLDIQAAIVETDELRHFSPSELSDENPVYDQENTAKVIEKIKNSKKPVILAGTGIRLGKAYEEFLHLVDRLQIPVVTAWNAHDVLWDTHPLYCGRPGTLGTRGGNFVVQNADLLITLGCRLNIRQISYSYDKFAANAYKIVVDIDQAELMKPTISPDLPIHANVKDFIQSMLDANYENHEKVHKKWLEWCRTINEKYPAVLPSYYEMKSPVNPYVFIDKLFHQLDKDEVIITGNGSACVITFQAALIKPGQRLFTNSGCATMGYGVPAAFGASVALKGRRVICLDGDGSIQMNIQELQTIAHHKSNIKLFILNNEGYHSMRQTQTNLFQGELVGVSKESGISFPDFEKLAGAYGILYYRISKLEETEPIITQAIAGEGPVICEVMLDKSQNFEPKLSSKVMPDGRIVSPEIDDLYPFLDREEYKANKNVQLS